MESMKIVHVITGLRKAAGTTTFCLCVVEEQQKLGHDVAIVLPGDLLPASADVVHIHGLWTPWLHRMHRWAHGIGAKVVLSTHGMTAPWAMQYKRWKKIVPWFVYQRRDIARADLIHTTTSLETKWVRNLGFKNKIAEVPLGTDLPEECAKFDSETKELLFVGRITPIKGLDVLSPAWNRVDSIGWKLKIVGPDQDGYLETIKSLVQKDNVEFVGPLFGEDLQRAYNQAHALILPSYTENFGGVVVDALAHGLPVLTSEGTDWNFLEEKVCGWHFPLQVEALAEKLEILFQTASGTLKEMGVKGRRLAEERYTWPAIAQNMCAAYEEILSDVDSKN